MDGISFDVRFLAEASKKSHGYLWHEWFLRYLGALTANFDRLRRDGLLGPDWLPSPSTDYRAAYDLDSLDLEKFTDITGLYFLVYTHHKATTRIMSGDPAVKRVLYLRGFDDQTDLAVGATTAFALLRERHRQADTIVVFGVDAVARKGPGLDTGLALRLSAELRWAAAARPDRTHSPQEWYELLAKEFTVRTPPQFFDEIDQLSRRFAQCNGPAGAAERTAPFEFRFQPAVTADELRSIEQFAYGPSPGSVRRDALRRPPASVPAAGCRSRDVGSGCAGPRS